MKTGVKILSLLLALLMLLPLSTLFAAASQEVCPLIYIHGFMGSEILENRNDPNSKVLWGPDTEAILNEVKDALPEFLKLLVKKDWNRFGDLAFGIVEPYFRPVYNNPDGTTQGESGVWFPYPDRGSITPDSELDFIYDWRLDPMEIAAQLNDFINYVCDAAGTSQVNLRSHSFGGVVVVTYLKLFGSEKVRGSFFDSVAIYGESFSGEIMSGDLQVSVPAMMDFMAYAFDDMEYHELLDEIAQTAERIGLIPLLVALGNELIDNLKMRLFKELMLPMYANWLPIWSLIPDEYVDSSLRFIFDELCAGEDRSALREKIDAYNTQIRPFRTRTLEELNENAHVYVLSRTGYASNPLTSSHQKLSDGTLDTAYTSFGATTALYGEELSADVIAKADPAFISPEKDIDASTCLFPQQTWFLRNAHHGDTLDPLTEFAAFLLGQPQQVTVDTFKEYPRFLIWMPFSQEILPDPGPTKKSWIDRLKELFAEIRLLILQIFSK